MMTMPTSGPAHSAMTELSTDTRDRVIRLECDLAHAVRTIDGINAKVTTMHELMLQGAGAVRASRWIGHGMTAGIAFVVSQGRLGQVGHETALPAPARVFRCDQQGLLEEARGLVARAFGSARPGGRNILAYYMAGPVHI